MGMKVDRLVMIVSDTVRWNYLGYNGGQVRTPNLDRLASQSVVFDRYYAGSFPTVPTRFDFFTGQPAYVETGWGPLPREAHTITNDLSEVGYKLCGVVDTPFYQANGYHYDRGFHYFYDMRSQPFGTPAYEAHVPSTGGNRRQQAGLLPQWPITGKLLPEPRVTEFDHTAAQTMTQAEKCLEYLYKDPFFLLVDGWDPHEPWDAPEYYVKHYMVDYGGERIHPPYGRYHELGLSERDLSVAQALYSGELELVDRWIGRLLNKLEYLNIVDSTAIIFVTDHGFYLGEHGFLGKMVRRAPGEATWQRSPLYEEITHIPLMIHVPGVAPKRVNTLTSALDIAPTLRALAGLSPSPDMLGQSLVPAILGDRVQGHEAVITALPLANPGEKLKAVDDIMRTVVEWQPVTITTQEWALLYSVPTEPIELYYLPEDPTQTSNVADKHPDVVKRLIDIYMSQLEAAHAAEVHVAPRRPDAGRSGH